MHQATCMTMGGAVPQFIQRGSSLDSTHVNAYTTLIYGLIQYAIIYKFDFLYVYATVNTATAVLNLVSARYNGTLHATGGNLTFTTDRGFTNTNTNTTDYIDTGFNPSTAPNPQYTLNSAHFYYWCLTNTSQSNPDIGNNTGSVSAYMFQWSNDSKVYFRINETNQNDAYGPIGGIGFAHQYIGVRVSASSKLLYIDGVSTGSSSTGSSSLNNLNFYAMGLNNNGAILSGAGQMAAMSAGTQLSSTDASNFNTLVRAYGTAVGIP